MVLERAGDDFRGRSRTTIDQDDDRLGFGQVARPGVEALRLLGIAAAGRNDLALVQERIRDRNRLIEQAARIVAQIDDEPFDLVGAKLAGQIVIAFFRPSVVCSVNCVIRI